MRGKRGKCLRIGLKLIADFVIHFVGITGDKGTAQGIERAGTQNAQLCNRLGNNPALQTSPATDSALWSNRDVADLN